MNAEKVARGEAYLRAKARARQGAQDMRARALRARRAAEARELNEAAPLASPRREEDDDK